MLLKLIHFNQEQILMKKHLRELASSIKELGVIQPITVTKIRI